MLNAINTAVKLNTPSPARLKSSVAYTEADSSAMLGRMTLGAHGQHLLRCRPKRFNVMSTVPLYVIMQRPDLLSSESSLYLIMTDQPSGSQWSRNRSLARSQQSPVAKSLPHSALMALTIGTLTCVAVLACRRNLNPSFSAPCAFLVLSSSVSRSRRAQTRAHEPESPRVHAPSSKMRFSTRWGLSAP